MTILPLAKLSRLVYLFFNERCFRVRVRIDTYPNPNTNRITKHSLKKGKTPALAPSPRFTDFVSAGISNNIYCLLCMAS